MQLSGNESTLYETCPCNIQRIFSALKLKNFIEKKKDNFYIFAQNIDCGFILEPLAKAVLTSTHKLCFGKKVDPCIPQFYYIKVEFTGGIHCMDMLARYVS